MMKKLALTIGILLTMGLGASAQSLLQREDNDLLLRDGTDITTPLIPNFGETEDQNGPLGSGIAVLVGLGAAYMVAKKRKED